MTSPIVGSAYIVARVITKKAKEDIQNVFESSWKDISKKADKDGEKAGRSYSEGFSRGLNARRGKSHTLFVSETEAAVAGARAGSAYRTAYDRAASASESRHRTNERSADADNAKLTRAAMARQRAAAPQNTESTHTTNEVVKRTVKHDTDTSTVDRARKMAPITIGTRLDDRATGALRKSLMGISLMLKGIAAASVAAMAALAGQAAIGGLSAIVALLSQVSGLLMGIPAGMMALGGVIATIKIGTKGIGEALSASANAQKESAAQANALTSAQRGVEAASRGVEQAQEGIVRAEKTASDAAKDHELARKAVTQAIKDQAEKIEDLNLQLKGSALDEEDALIGVERARERINKLDSSASALDIREANLGYKQAVQRLEEVRESNGDLREEAAKTNKEGIEGSEQVIAARRNEADAAYAVVEAQKGIAESHRNLADAQQGLADAIRSMNEAASGTTAFQDAMAKLSPIAQGLVTTLIGLKGAWQDFKFSIQDKLLVNLGDQIKQVSDRQLPVLESGLGHVATSLNHIAGGLLAAFGSVGFAEKFQIIFDRLASALDIAAPGFTNLAIAFMDIATVGSEFFERIAKGFTDGSGKIKLWAEDFEKVRGIIDKAFTALGEVFHILGVIGDAIVTVFSAVPLQPFIDAINTTLGTMQDFLHSAEGQNGLRVFFDNALDALYILGPAVTEIFKGIMDVGNILAGFGANIAPGFTAFIIGLREAINNLRPLFENLAPVISRLFADIGKLLPKIAETLSDLGSALGPLIDTLRVIVSSILPPFLSLLGNLAPILAPLAGMILAIVAATKGLAILKAISGWTAPATTGLKTFNEQVRVQQHLAGMQGQSVNRMTGAWAVMESRSGTLSRMSDTYRTITTRTGEFADKQKAMGTQLGGLGGAFRTAASHGANFGGMLGGALAGGLRGAATGIGNLISALGGPWMIALTAVIGVITQIVSSNAKVKKSSEDAKKASEDFARAQKAVHDAMTASAGVVNDDVLGALASQVDTVHDSAKKLAGDGPNFFGKVSSGLGSLFGVSADAAIKAGNLADANKRLVEQFDKTGFSSDELAEKIGGTDEEFAKLLETVKAQGSWDLARKLEDMREELIKDRDPAVAIKDAIKDIKDKAVGAADGVDRMTSALARMRGDSLTVEEAQVRVTTALDGLRTSVESNGRAVVDASGNIDLTTTAGVNLFNAMKDVSGAYDTAASAAKVSAENQGLSAEETQARVRAAQDQVRTDFINTAIQAGYTEQQAKALADRFINWPPTAQTLITTNAGEVNEELDHLLKTLWGLEEANPNVHIVTPQEGVAGLLNPGGVLGPNPASSPAPTPAARSGDSEAERRRKEEERRRKNEGLFGSMYGYAKGGRVLKLADGGPSGVVKGPGTGTSDSIMAALSAGEFVVNAQQTQNNLPLLNMINQGLDVPLLQAIDQGIKPAWELLGAAINAVWATVIQPTWDALRIAFEQTAFFFQKLINEMFNPAWAGLGDGIRKGWEEVIQPTWGALTTAIQGMAGIFDTAVNGIKLAWDRLGDIARRPVEFAVNTVLNGLIDGFNQISKSVPLIPHIDRINADALRATPAFARGGVMSGYSPGRDDRLIAVGGGEAVMRPEWTRAVGSGYVDTMNAAARKGGVSGVRAALGDGDQRRNAYKPAANSRQRGRGAAFLAGGTIQGDAHLTSPIQNTMWDAVRTAFPMVVLTSGTRYEDVGSGFDNHMGQRAIDLGGPMDEISRWIYQMNAKQPVLELIHWPLNGWENLKNGAPLNYGGSTNSQHEDHVHWAMAEMVDNAGKLISMAGGNAAFGRSSAGSRAIMDFEKTVSDVKAKIDAGVPGFAPEGGVFNEIPMKAFDFVVAKMKEFIQSKAPSGGSGNNDMKGQRFSGPDMVPIVQNSDGTWTSPNPAWAHLIQRESGGNPRIVQGVIDVNTGGNEASGLFQIAKGTWASNGGLAFAPTAGEAAPQDQAKVAARIFKASGGGPWGAGLAGRESEEELAKFARGGIVAGLFDGGGKLPPGVHIIWNNTGKDETIRTFEEEVALQGQLNYQKELENKLKLSEGKVQELTAGLEAAKQNPNTPIPTDVSVTSTTLPDPSITASAIATAQPTTTTTMPTTTSSYSSTAISTATSDAALQRSMQQFRKQNLRPNETAEAGAAWDKEFEAELTRIRQEKGPEPGEPEKADAYRREVDEAALSVMEDKLRTADAAKADAYTKLVNEEQERQRRLGEYTTSAQALTSESTSDEINAVLQQFRKEKLRPTDTPEAAEAWDKEYESQLAAVKQAMGPAPTDPKKLKEYERQVNEAVLATMEDQLRTADAAKADAYEKQVADERARVREATRRGKLSLTPKSSSASGAAGEAASALTQNALETFFDDNPNFFGAYDDRSSSHPSMGARFADPAKAAVSGQLDSALGIFGLNTEPPWLQAIQKFNEDNPPEKLNTQPAQQQPGAAPAPAGPPPDQFNDLVQALFNAGSVTVNINGNANGVDVANRIDQARRRTLRRYVK